MKADLQEALARFEAGGQSYLAFRVAATQHQVGEVLSGRSRHNPDREDEREFPEFGSEEYVDLPELDGLSAWRTSPYLAERDLARLLKGSHSGEFVYLLAAEERGHHPNPDEGEVVLVEPVVLGVWRVPAREFTLFSLPGPCYSKVNVPGGAIAGVRCNMQSPSLYTRLMDLAEDIEQSWRASTDDYVRERLRGRARQVRLIAREEVGACPHETTRNLYDQRPPSEGRALKAAGRLCEACRRTLPLEA